MRRGKGQAICWEHEFSHYVFLSSFISPGLHQSEREEYRITGFDSEHRVGELALQYWLRELGVFDWLGILDWFHRVCLFCRGLCLVSGLSWCAVGLFGALRALGRVVSVGTESKSSPGDSTIGSFAFLSARV